MQQKSAFFATRRCRGPCPRILLLSLSASAPLASSVVARLLKLLTLTTISSAPGAGLGTVCGGGRLRLRLLKRLPRGSSSSRSGISRSSEDSSERLPRTAPTDGPRLPVQRDPAAILQLRDRNLVRERKAHEISLSDRETIKGVLFAVAHSS